MASRTTSVNSTPYPSQPTSNNHELSRLSDTPKQRFRPKDSETLVEENTNSGDSSSAFHKDYETFERKRDSSELDLSEIKKATETLIQEITKTAKQANNESPEEPEVFDEAKVEKTEEWEMESLSTQHSQSTDYSLRRLKQEAPNLLQMATVCKSKPEPLCSYDYEDPNIYYSPTKNYRKRKHDQTKE